MSQHDGITPPARPLVSFTPMNMQEHENDIRAIVNTHQGFGGGNPSQWVIKAGLECFSRGFGEGYAAAQAQANKAVPPMQQAATALFPHEAKRLVGMRARREVEGQHASPEFFVETQPRAQLVYSDERVSKLIGEGDASDIEFMKEDQARLQWVKFFNAALSGTAASAGPADAIVNFAREIADTALQAWRER